MISQEEFEQWQHNPVTKAIFALLESRREVLRRQWEAGSFTDYDAGTTALVNVGNLGMCRGYAYVTELTYDDYVSEIDDGEPERAGTPGSSSAD
jgi:hypothetical protein